MIKLVCCWLKVNFIIEFIILKTYRYNLVIKLFWNCLKFIQLFFLKIFKNFLNARFFQKYLVFLLIIFFFIFLVSIYIFKIILVSFVINTPINLGKWHSIFPYSQKFFIVLFIHFISLKICYVFQIRLF